MIVVFYLVEGKDMGICIDRLVNYLKLFNFNVVLYFFVDLKFFDLFGEYKGVCGIIGFFD